MAKVTLEDNYFEFDDNNRQRFTNHKCSLSGRGRGQRGVTGAHFCAHFLNLGMRDIRVPRNGGNYSPKCCIHPSNHVKKLPD